MVSVLSKVVTGFLAGLMALVLILLAVWYCWFQPVYFAVDVRNNSGETIDLFRLYGDGVESEQQVSALANGAETKLQVQLQGSGELRFESVRGYNRIDTVIASDVTNWHSQEQLLTIHPNNRFVFAEMDGNNESTTD